MSETYPADLYALIHRGTPGDLAFYRDRCADATSVLELGCGYGRILMALTRPDLRLVGLDRDPGMLALAREHIARMPQDERGPIELVQADMRHFAFSDPFDRVLIPFSGIYCLLSREECLQCLRAAAAALKPDGLLVFDAYCADALHGDDDYDTTEEDPEPDEPDPLVTVEYEGMLFDVYEESDWSPTEQRLTVDYHHHPRSPAPATRGRIHHRYWLSHQIPDLLAEAGLRLLTLHSDFDSTPLTPDAELLIATATPL